MTIAVRYIVTMVCMLLTNISFATEVVDSPEAILQPAIEKNVPDNEKADLQKLLTNIDPSLQLNSYRQSELPGFYEVIVNNKVVFISKDKKYLIAGSVLKVSGAKIDPNDKVGNEYLNDHRADFIKELNKESYITYTPIKVLSKVTVFTDIDCYYCQKFHNDIKEYVNKGIEVSYISYPAGGAGSAGYVKAIDVWCSEDQKKAMSDAKKGLEVSSKNCEHPINEHMVVARKLSVHATPTMLFEDGYIVPGYLPPEELSKLAKAHSLRED